MYRVSIIYCEYIDILYSKYFIIDTITALRAVIGASLSEPHTNNKFVRWFVRRKTAVKSGLLHTTVSLVGWFKHYNTRKITLIEK